MRLLATLACAPFTVLLTPPEMAAVLEAVQGSFARPGFAEGGLRVESCGRRLTSLLGAVTTEGD